jgi:hypothetical protein
MPSRTKQIQPVPDEVNDIALANTGLIAFVIERFRLPTNDDYTFDDAWQDGWFGLVRAVQNFDPSRGFKFSTFAVAEIRSAVQKGRGRHEGLNYRHEERVGAGTGLTLVDRELSIDAPNGQGETIADRIPATGCVEDQAIAASHLSLIRDAAASICDDDIDRAIFDRIVDADETATGIEIQRAVAESHGITFDAAYRRRRKLLGRIVELFDPSEQAA